MNADRMGGASPADRPDKTSSADIQRREMQKIEKVREVDPDEAARKRKKFKAALEGEDKSSKGPKSPSPFETAFYEMPDNPKKSNKPTLGSSRNAANPSYTNPPNPQAPPPPQQQQEQQEPPLPQSNKFYRDIDYPPDQPVQNRQKYREKQLPGNNQKNDSPSMKAATKKEKKEEAKLKEEAAKKKEEALFGSPADIEKKKIGSVPGKEKPDEDALSLASRKAELEILAAPEEKKKKVGKGLDEKKLEARPLTPEEQMEKALETPEKKQGKKDEKTEERGAKTALPDTERKGKPESKPSREHWEKAQRELEASPALPPTDSEGTPISRDKKDDKKSTEIALPSLPGLPPHVEAPAQAAVQRVMPYLNPEVQPLFYQMVGQVMIMSTPPGISKTEVMLNNPAFANSVFYGSTISFTTYSTAPASFNIQLSGNNQAVTIFNQNLASLQSAFQASYDNGAIAFRVNRLEAAYATDRPVFKRKDERGREGGAAGGDTTKGNR